jgi:hypothetical protein
MNNQIMACIGLAIGALGVLLTIVFAWRTARVKRFLILGLWGSATTILHTFDFLDDTKKLLHSLDLSPLDPKAAKDLLAKVEGARETTKIIWKNLLTHIVMETPGYDVHMIRAWVNRGRLRGRNLQELEYRVRSALELLPDKRQDNQEMERLLKQLPKTDFDHLVVYPKAEGDAS